MSAPGDSLGTAAVVGGGPGGLMAAEVLVGAGMAVTVYELRRSVGRKFLLAGRSGLNITHAADPASLADHYGPRRANLAPALDAFGPDELARWCAELGEPTFVGTSGRVFPASFRATPLLRAWLARLVHSGVEFRTGHRWLGWSARTHASRFERSDGSVVEVAPDVTVLALGGASWPRVSSDGSWTRSLDEAGIGVTPLRAANCGVCVAWSDHVLDRFVGRPLKNISVTVGPHATVRGDAMITATGLEGGPIYAHSAAIREQLDRTGTAVIEVDLQPDLSASALAARFDKGPAQSISSRLRSSRLAPEAVALLRDVVHNELPTNVEGLVRLIKATPVEVTALMAIERAISSAGGVRFDELDGSYMLRRRPGTFVAGEMLDWEAPTGGFLLQGTFSTAVAAANGALAWLELAPGPRTDGLLSPAMP